MESAYQDNTFVFEKQSNFDFDDGPNIDSFVFTDLKNIRHFRAKDVIYHKGDTIDKVYFIRFGMIKLLSYLPNGRARIVRLHAKGHWLGLEGLLGRRFTHTAQAVGDVEVVYRSLSSMNQLLRDNPGYNTQVLQQIFRQLAQADRWIAEFSTGGIKSRVARLLDFLAKLEFGESVDRVELLSVNEMADVLGVTPESVSRVMAEFKRNNTLSKIRDTPVDIFKLDSLQLQIESQL